jgi:hypothetical protein
MFRSEAGAGRFSLSTGFNQTPSDGAIGVSDDGRSLPNLPMGHGARFWPYLRTVLNALKEQVWAFLEMREVISAEIGEDGVQIGGGC